MYVTDDWVAGAELMNLSRPLVERTLRDNLREADVCAAVSPHLGAVLREAHDFAAGVVLIPNGCELPDLGDEGAERHRNAGLIGQLNERLDMRLLEAVEDAGVPLLVIGPRTDHDPGMGRRLDAFLAAPNVTWLGELPSKDLAPHLAEIGVGLTPYADTAFNRSSFPLKTLEYLAAGMPVVSSDLPAVRWLNTELVAVASDPVDFANQVQRLLDNPDDASLRNSRRGFAALHTWQARAVQFLGAVQEAQAQASSEQARFSGTSGRRPDGSHQGHQFESTGSYRCSQHRIRRLFIYRKAGRNV
ncbi:MAG: glycosyltransferase [Arthrobacter sp.]|nr:glycosyltransferase [Arthrobacter sp.]